MDYFPRPRIVVSQCLGFDACRFDGDMIPDRFVDKLKSFTDVLPVCPEVTCGLGVPRDPIRIVIQSGKRILYQPATGQDVTSIMMNFITGYFQRLKDVDGFILKSRSPSCGLKDVKIYMNKEYGAQSTRGSGFFGQAVLDGFVNYPVEDESCLCNYTVREHFLTAIFTMARFRIMNKAPRMDALLDFHARHKYLFMAYNEKQYRILGKITANHEKKKRRAVFKEYQTHLCQVFEKPVQTGAMINAFMYGFGAISSRLSSEEKRYFLNTIEAYRDEQIPRSVLLHLLQSWSVRFQNHHLLNQMLFHPYPLELIEVTDSGKGKSMHN